MSVLPLTMDKVAAKVKDFFAVNYDIRSPITDSMTLQNNIGLDSLDMLWLICELESEFGIELRETQLFPEMTIGQVKNIIAEKL